MDDELKQQQALEALPNVLNSLSEKPYDLSIHAQHIHVTQALGIQSEVIGALETFTKFYAAGDDVWLPLLESKEAATDVDNGKEVLELLGTFQDAEKDYLSIPILKRHMEFVISRYEAYHSEDSSIPEQFEDEFSVEWTRQHLAEVMNKGTGHLAQSHVLWELLVEWEMAVLETASGEEKPAHIIATEALILNRLQQPHSNSDSTFNTYSSFTTNHKPPAQYEATMLKASKSRGQAVKAAQRRETFETKLEQSQNSLEAFQEYVLHERRAKTPDMFLLRGVYERAIAAAAKRRFNVNDESGPHAEGEMALRVFWCGYLDALRANDVPEESQLEVVRRAVRSVPGSGEVWARYLRILEVGNDKGSLESGETIRDVYLDAFQRQVVQSDVEQIVPVVLAVGGYEKRRIEGGDEMLIGEAMEGLIESLNQGMKLVREVSEAGDPRLRLERFLSDFYRSIELHEKAIEVWKDASAFYKRSYLMWTAYTDCVVQCNLPDLARNIFSDICMKNIDWPEAIWEAWLQFEHVHGSVESIYQCMDKVEKATIQVQARRRKDAERAMQFTAEQQASVPVTEAPIPVATEDAMEVDEAPAERGVKRPAEDELSTEGQKRARKEKPPLKRDRENSTVIVSDLTEDVTDDDLVSLFKDCGKIRETKITNMANSTVATVEFLDRDSVPAALTKDKKRINGNEIAVHLAWQSTLYITNFPESADDAWIRELFGKYGTIFEVRWPSKKFKNTRRFCYLQYTSPSFANASLELHQKEFEHSDKGTIKMNVFISNPDRKKERSDADVKDREVHVGGLNKNVTQAELKRFFGQYGSVKEVRLATDDNGSSKGFAFVEFEEARDAQQALEANNQDLKNRRISVTLVDPRGKGKKSKFDKQTGLGRKAELQNRSIRIRNLPPSTQDGLLQQALEKIVPVKRLEVFKDKAEAVVEFESAAEVGKLLLRTEPLMFNGNELKLSEEATAGPTATSKSNVGFVPRAATSSRPKAGLGHKRKLVTPISQNAQVPAASGSSGSGTDGAAKGQDDFRKMLGTK